MFVQNNKKNKNSTAGRAKKETPSKAHKDPIIFPGQV